MYVTAGGPYGNYRPPYFAALFEERRQLRRTASGVCWAALAGIFFMSWILPEIGLLGLKTMGYSIRTAAGGFIGLPPVVYYLVSCADYLIGLAAPALIYFAASRTPLSQGLPFRKTKAWETLLFVAFGCMVCLLANFPANVVSEVQKSFGFSGAMPESPLTNDPLVLFLYVVNVVLIPPLVEEMMFRGVILQSLRRWGDGFAVLFSAMLFGFYHGNFIQMIFAFLCGLALGYVAVRTNSLLPSILIHAVNNGLSVLYELVTRFYGKNASLWLNGAVSMLVLILGAIAVIILAVTHRLIFGPEKKTALPFSSRLGAAFGNFGGVVFILYAVVASISRLYHG